MICCSGIFLFSRPLHFFFLDFVLPYESYLISPLTYLQGKQRQTQALAHHAGAGEQERLSRGRGVRRGSGRGEVIFMLNAMEIYGRLYLTCLVAMMIFTVALYFPRSTASRVSNQIRNAGRINYTACTLYKMLRRSRAPFPLIFWAPV